MKAPMKGDRHVLVLNLCRSAQSRAEIQQVLGISDRKQLGTRYLAPLIAQGYLTMTEPEHPKSRAQRYQTTRKGLTYLRKIDEG